MTDLKQDRPHMPGYGVSPESEGQLTWDWARERLEDSHNYFLGTSRPDGRPHIMPVWGIWLNGRFLFSTGESSVKARNLAASPAAVVTTENAEEVVIVEGTAALETDAAALAEFAAVYNEKYDWEIDTSAGGIWAVAPRVAFAFIEAADDFTETATRWRFPDSA
ncbi:MAG: pyridoxamine 5'-phosphate oxidase family protein [Dehalococcoidia bacterium]